MVELCSGRGRIYFGVSRALLNAFPPSLPPSVIPSYIPKISEVVLCVCIVHVIPS